MSGRKRGIFGIVKKKSMLFTFRPREGEECSSDSDDSDYFPGRYSTDEDDNGTLPERGETKAVKKKRKRASVLSTDSKQSSKRCRMETDPPVKNRNVRKGPPIRLPPEILLRVFLFGVQVEGMTKFLPRVSRVCKEWRDAASDPCFLRHLDLSAKGEGGDSSNGISRVITLTRHRLDKLLKARDLSQCQSLSLAGQSKLAVSNIKSMLTQTPRLTALDLRGCSVSPGMLKALPELCPSLVRLDLSQLVPTDGALSFKCSPMEGVMQSLGPRLVELRLGRFPLIRYFIQSMLKTVTQNCPLLEELDLRLSPMSGLGHATPSCTVDMGELARACPRLTELRLDGHNFVDNSGETQPYEPGFRRLRSYSQASQVHRSSDQPALYRMFVDNDLTELNLSRTSLLPSELKVRSIKNLYLADMKWRLVNDARGEITRCMLKWHNSIQLLDLSGIKAYRLHRELDFFTRPHACASSALQVINLSNSAEQADTVVSILRNCKSLCSIDLSVCRELPRGCRRLFIQAELSELLDSLLG